MSRDDIRRTCDLLFYPGQVVEIRSLSDTGTQVGYYSDWNRLSHDVDVIDGTAGFKGVYCTLNPVNPALLARKANRISKPVKGESATGDDDIIRRRWFPVDIDPKRPSGISSTEEEHEEALEKAQRIKGFLSELGWPEPIAADSGNGSHLLYRIDLPNDPKSEDLLQTCVQTLGQFFTDSRSDIDLTVYNASRIWKFYGTVSRKGDNVPDRPHRRSKVISCPEDIQTVPVSELMHLASLYSAPPDDTQSRNGGNGRAGNTGNTSSIDLGDWLTTHGVSYDERPYSSGRLFVLDECPFSSAHTDGAYAIQFDNGAIFAGCHHNSCGGGEQRWSELRTKYEGVSERATRPSQMTAEEYEEKRRSDIRDRAQAKAEFFGEHSSPDGQDSAPDATSRIDHTTEASRILREGDPIQYILNSFATDHEGDEVVAKSLIMSFASRSVINSNGLHVLVTGESGKGKSHAFDTMIQHIPQEFRLDGRMSDKALFYAEDLRAGSAICLDDVSLSEQMQETLKGVTTSFKKPFIYRTVNKDRKGQTCIIPERCVWWVAKMEGTGDDQVWNRMLTCWIDDSKEQDNKVLVRELSAAAALPSDNNEIRTEISVCHHIWNQLQPVYVVIPFAERIRFTSSGNRRNPGMLLDLIKSIATLHQYQRVHDSAGGREVIFATVEDFRIACSIYQALNGESGGQSTKLTRHEAMLIADIRRSNRYEFTMKELVDLSGKSYDAVRKLIRGNGTNGNHSGLLEKCPAITYYNRTDSSDRVSKTQLVYAWNDSMYEMWASGGKCWLDMNFFDHHDPDDGSTHTEIPERPENDRSAIGENFSPVIPDRTTDESQNNNNKNNFSTDRSNYPGAEQVSEPLPSYVSDPENVLRSSDRSDGDQTNGIPDLVCETGADSIGASISPEVLQTPDFTPITIDPDDYSPIDGVWGGPCAVCGGKWVHYTERFSAKMKAEGRFSHKICQKCYSKAVARVSMSFMALPGTINTAVMVPADKDYGRCKICDLGGVAWYDHETKTGICSICYTRERGRSGVMV